MRTPPLLADFIYLGACKPICEKSLTLPHKGGELMSVLSEKLNYFVGQRGVNIADLAKRCRIERSTLYQYLKDRRPLQNKVQLEALMSELHLTPDERAEMLEAYEIARIGMRDYSRRCKVRELLDSLLTVEETHPVRHEAEYDADAGEPEPHCLL